MHQSDAVEAEVIMSHSFLPLRTLQFRKTYKQITKVKSQHVLRVQSIMLHG